MPTSAIETTSVTVAVEDLRREIAPMVCLLKSNEATIPILNNLLISVGEGELKIACTNLDISLQSSIPLAGIVGDSRLVIPAAALSYFLERLTCPSVAISQRDGRVKLEAAGQSLDMPAGSIANFPDIQQFPEGDALAISRETLCSMISRTLYAASREESRYVLNAALLKAEDGTLRMVATDGHRMAACKTRDFTGVVEFLLSKSAMERIPEVFTGESPIEIIAVDKYAHFRQGRRSMVARIPPGQFPNWKALVKDEYGSPTTIVSAQTLLSILLTADRFNDARSGAVRLEIKDGSLTVTSKDYEQGTAFSVVVPLEVESLGCVSIGFNVEYLIDILRQIPGDVEMHFTDGNQAGVFRPAGSGDYTCLVMPMRM